MYNIRKLVVACLGLVGFGLLIFAVVAPAQAGETKAIKSEESGTFVSANFDFDHPDLSSPASYINGAGRDDPGGKFTDQFLDELKPDGHSCTVPGGVAGKGTEFTLVGDLGVRRFTATGDLLFLKSTSETLCQDFSTIPTPPFPLILTTTGVVTGGTGAFSGATGTTTFRVEGATLSLDATGARAFGWFQDTAVLTVTVPDSD